MEALRSLGVSIASFSTRRPANGAVFSERESLVAETTYLYELGLVRTLWELGLAGATFPHRIAWAKFFLFRDMLLGSFRHPSDRLKLVPQFTAAVLLARRLRRDGAQHLHAHFAHVPATIAMYAARMAGIPFSFTAHANDIFVRRGLIHEKTRRSAFTVCISEYNRRFLTSVGCAPETLRVVHCGVDLKKCPHSPIRTRTGPFTILAVGRLIEKKGFHVLLDAAARLRAQGRCFRCVIVGSGPQEGVLRAQATRLALDGAVEWRGGLPQEEVVRLFGEADAFALPCVRDKQGDQDGIPVVLMEAMARGTPVVATSISGLPELIVDGVSGLLAHPNDPAALAECLVRLMDHPALAQRLAHAARLAVEREFNASTNAAALLDLIKRTGT